MNLWFCNMQKCQNWNAWQETYVLSPREILAVIYADFTKSPKEHDWRFTFQHFNSDYTILVHILTK